MGGGMGLVGRPCMCGGGEDRLLMPALACWYDGGRAEGYWLGFMAREVLEAFAAAATEGCCCCPSWLWPWPSWFELGLPMGGDGRPGLWLPTDGAVAPAGTDVDVAPPLPFVVGVCEAVVDESEFVLWLLARPDGMVLVLLVLLFDGLRLEPTRFLKRWFMDDINSSACSRMSRRARLTQELKTGTRLGRRAEP